MPLGLGSAVPLLLLSGLVLEIVVILFLSRIPDCVLVWLYLVFSFVRRLGIKGGVEMCQWRRTRKERTALIL